MKKYLHRILFLTIFISTAATAQYTEYGIFIGGSQYQGDLVRDGWMMKETRPAIGLLGRYSFGANLALRGSFTFGTVGGSDANYTGVSGAEFRVKRNLSFRSR